MKKIKLFKTLLIPSLGVLTLGTIEAVATSCGCSIVHVTAVSLNKDTFTLAQGKTEQLIAAISPENATNKNVTWSSSNDRVATVDENGLVTAVDGGTVTITVTTEDGEFTATCNVTVTVPVTGVAVNPATISIKVTETYRLQARVLPSNATNQKINWSSSDASIVSVNSSIGLIKAYNRAGSATITVTTEDGKFTATCNVTVTLP